MDEATRAYLDRALDLEGGGNLGALVAHRNSWVLGASTLTEPEVDRDAAREILVEVAQNLDQLSAEQFHEQADRLDLSRWPDLEGWRRKMAGTLALRSAYAAAHRDEKLDSKTFETIWALAICPDRDAVQLRDMFERDISRRALRRAWRTVRRLRRSYPAVWANQRTFVDRIEQLGRERRRIGPMHWVFGGICLVGAIAFLVYLKSLGA